LTEGVEEEEKGPPEIGRIRLHLLGTAETVDWERGGD